MTDSRLYKEAWETLRDNLVVEIVARDAYHTRIYNGIRKERYRDLAHTVYLDQTNQREVMHVVKTKTSIKFVLKRIERLTFDSLF